LTILFKKSLANKIISGEKTATRRPKRPMVKPGGEYNIRVNFYTHLPDRYRVIKRFQQRLGDMSHDDALNEGFRDLDEFREEWKSIYGADDPDQVVWVVEFEYIEPDRA
jgi:hypothetical protein